MKMNNIKITTKGWAFDGYIISQIVKEFITLKKGEFKEAFDKCEKIIGHPINIIITNNILEFISDNEFMINKTYDQMTDIVKRLYEYEKSGLNVEIFKTEFNGGDYGDHKFKLDNVSIRLNTDNLNKWIVREFDNIDNLIKEWKLSIRHEIGHMIDFMSYHGMDMDELESLRKSYEDEKNEFYKEIMVNKPQQKQEFTLKYHQLQEEAVADLNAGIDISEYLKLDAISDSIGDYRDLEITYNINITRKPLELAKYDVCLGDINTTVKN
jgi:hypothetical protein